MSMPMNLRSRPAREVEDQSFKDSSSNSSPTMSLDKKLSKQRRGQPKRGSKSGALKKGSKAEVSRDVGTKAASKELSVKARKAKSAVKPKSKEKKNLLARIHVSEIPDELPCREAEAAEIESFIRTAVEQEEESMAMYISGVPGTGKTTTVEAVAKALLMDHTCPPFHYIAVNGMEYVNPRQVFSEIYNRLHSSAKPVSALTARRRLEETFVMADSQRLPLVILVDEFDQLCNKKQDIIYTIVNWSALPSSRVNIIAIANTLDFPERVLTNRNASRLGSHRVIFQPYEHDQIERIVEARLEDSDEIDKDAIKLACRSVASTTGDLRKALEILRRAYELAKEKGEDVVRTDHVIAVRKELNNSSRVEMCKSFSRHQLILFKAVVSSVQSLGREEVSFSCVYSNYRLLCTQSEGISPLDCVTARQLMLDIARNGFVSISPLATGSSWLVQQLRLGMDTQDAQLCIKLTEDERGRYTYELKPGAH